MTVRNDNGGAGIFHCEKLLECIQQEPHVFFNQSFLLKWNQLVTQGERLLCQSDGNSSTDGSGGQPQSVVGGEDGVGAQPAEDIIQERPEAVLRAVNEVDIEAAGGGSRQQEDHTRDKYAEVDSSCDITLANVSGRKHKPKRKCPLARRQDFWDNPFELEPKQGCDESHTQCEAAQNVYSYLKEKHEAIAKFYSTQSLPDVVSTEIDNHESNSIIQILERDTRDAVHFNSAVRALACILLLGIFLTFYDGLKGRSLKKFAAQWEKGKIVRNHVLLGHLLVLLESYHAGAGMLAIHAKDKLNRLPLEEARCFADLVKKDRKLQALIQPPEGFQNAFCEFCKWTSRQLTKRSLSQDHDSNEQPTKRLKSNEELLQHHGEVYLEHVTNICDNEQQYQIGFGEAGTLRNSSLAQYMSALNLGNTSDYITPIGGDRSEQDDQSPTSTATEQSNALSEPELGVTRMQSLGQPEILNIPEAALRIQLSSPSSLTQSVRSLKDVTSASQSSLEGPSLENRHNAFATHEDDSISAGLPTDQFNTQVLQPMSCSVDRLDLMRTALRSCSTERAVATDSSASADAAFASITASNSLDAGLTRFNPAAPCNIQLPIAARTERACSQQKLPVFEDETPASSSTFPVTNLNLVSPFFGEWNEFCAPLVCPFFGDTNQVNAPLVSPFFGDWNDLVRPL